MESVQVPKALAAQLARPSADIFGQRDPFGGPAAEQFQHLTPLLVGTLPYLEQDDFG
jgi:hypothetical protein